MLRSGQPLCGTSQNRCSEDIQLLNSFLANKCRGKVIDVRSPLVLQQHQNKGLVTIATDAYKICKIPMVIIMSCAITSNLTVKAVSFSSSALRLYHLICFVCVKLKLVI